MNRATIRRAKLVVAGGLALALFVTLFVDVAVLTVPIYDMQLYDRVLLSHNMSTVAMLSVACAVGLVLYAIFDYLRSATLVAIAESFARILGTEVLEAGVRHSLGGRSAAGGEAIRDLSEIRGFLSSGAVSVPLDALCAPFLVAVMFMLHPAFGWLALAGVASLVIFGIVADVLVRPAVTAAAQERSQAGNLLAAGLREPELTEGLGMLPALTRRWAERHGAALRRTRLAGQRSDTVAAVAKVVKLGLQAGVMALGAILILSHEASAGSLMGANLLLGKVIGPFDSLVSSWRRWIGAAAAWHRIRTLLADIKEPGGEAQPEMPGEPGLALSGLGFAEPATGRMLLRDIDLHLPPGTATALVGANGAGKSTLMRLVVGLLAPSTGCLRFDGVPIRNLDRARIGFLPQGVHLLDGTVSDNVARFQDAPVEEVIAAATTVGVHEMVGRMRQGYGTAIGSGALTLSGGQKQRVGLARALFRHPSILALDEPDASLDQFGEEALLQAIHSAREAGTVVIVATHRTKLLAAMDLIVTMRDGRIESAKPPSRVAALPLQPATA